MGDVFLAVHSRSSACGRPADDTLALGDRLGRRGGGLGGAGDAAGGIISGRGAGCSPGASKPCAAPTGDWPGSATGRWGISCLPPRAWNAGSERCQ